MMIPKTMKAAILVEQKAPLQIDEISLPGKLDYGQILVKIHFSGICGSQLGEIDGVKGDDPYLPHLLGHEGAGEVLATGRGVNRLIPGDNVVLHWRQGSGIQAPLPEYKWKGKKINAGFVTTFNEFAVVSENRVTKIPDDYPMEIASLFGCAVTTGLGVINNNAKLKIGESIVVFGAGGIGLNVIQGAALVSAYPIIAIDVHDNRLALARKLGATHLINSTIEDVDHQVRSIIGDSGADVIVDNTGNTSVIKLCYELTASTGKTILVGVPKKHDNINIYSLPLHFEKTITGSHGGESNPSIDIPKYIRLNRHGQLNLNDLISDRFDLENINTAIDGIRNGEIAGRCLIRMNSDAE